MRILIADKDPNDLEAMKVGLSAPDIEIFTASDGHTALNLAIEHAPHVVICSASLGHMGGFALSHEIKGRAALSEMPEAAVIVLLERPGDDWLANWSRCDEFRTKPVDPDELETMVREAGTRPHAVGA